MEALFGYEEMPGFSFFPGELNFIDVMKHGYWLYRSPLTSWSWIILCLSLIDKLFQSFAFLWIFFSSPSYFCYNFFEIQLCTSSCSDEILWPWVFFLSNPFSRTYEKKTMLFIFAGSMVDSFWLLMRIWWGCWNCSSSNNNGNVQYKYIIIYGWLGHFQGVGKCLGTRRMRVRPDQIKHKKKA